MNAPFLLTQPKSGMFTGENLNETDFPHFVVELKPAKRSKIWQLKEANRCPLIGTCLSVDDLLRFAKRYHFKALSNDAFLLHVEMVNYMATRNPISEAVQKHLDARYQLFIARFESAKTDAEVLNLWKQCFTHGEIAGALWAALTHKEVSDETRGKIYADIHMHAHQMGAGQAADARRLIQLEKDHAEMKIAMEQQKQKHERTEAKLRQRLQGCLAEAQHLHRVEKNLTVLQARLATIESGKTMTEMGQRLMKLTIDNEQLQTTVRQLDQLKQSLQLACNKIASLIRDREILTKERDTLKARLLTVTTHDVPDELPHSCDEPQIQHDCVICVGGRIALLPQYRSLAEQLGIHLIHHDGGQQDALSRLPEMISRADAVICPTDCVSHAAYYQLKRLCKRNGKPCLLFRGTGVSSFATALAKLTSGKASINSVDLDLSEKITE
jgi:hypothetical protein